MRKNYHATPKSRTDVKSNRYPSIGPDAQLDFGPDPVEGRAHYHHGRKSQRSSAVRREAHHLGAQGYVTGETLGEDAVGALCPCLGPGSQGDGTPPAKNRT